MLTCWRDNPGWPGCIQRLPAAIARLAAVVVIDEPGGDLYYGSDVAAPVFAGVMAESLRLLAVAPDALPALDSDAVMQAMSQ